jgi:hypothetical protein
VGRVKRVALRLSSTFVATVWLSACQSGPSAREQAQAREAEAAAAAAAAAPAAPPPPLEPGQEMSLFDGSTLGLWKVENLGRQGDVRVADGAIHLDWGNPGTEIRWGGPEVATGYELRFELQRGQGGGDAFCFVIFPFGNRSCTLVLGDWVGVQCRAEGADAAERGALKRIALEPERWHAVQLRVLRDRIQATLDGEPAVDLPLEDPDSAAASTAPPRPLGIATWSMAAALREIHLRRLADAR